MTTNANDFIVIPGSDFGPRPYTSPGQSTSMGDSIYYNSPQSGPVQGNAANLVSNAGNLLLNGFRRGSTSGGSHPNFSNSGRLESGVLGDYTVSPHTNDHYRSPAMHQRRPQQQASGDLMFWNSPPNVFQPAFSGHNHSQSHSGAFSPMTGNIGRPTTDSMPPPPPQTQTLRRGASFTNAPMNVDPAPLARLNTHAYQSHGIPQSPVSMQTSTVPSTPNSAMPQSPVPPYSPVMPMSHPSSPAISVHGESSRPPLPHGHSQRSLQLSPSPLLMQAPPPPQSAQARLQKSPALSQPPNFYTGSPSLSPYSSSGSKFPQAAYDQPRSSTSSQFYTPRLSNSPSIGSSSASTSPTSTQHTFSTQQQQQQPPARRPAFKRFRHRSELKHIRNPAPAERRADPQGGFISPLRALTTHLLQTYNVVNPAFRYEASHNPRRVLTKPSVKAGNDGYDNEDADYILYVNDWLGNEEGNKYLILDILGQGTFGQVVKCQNMKTHEIVAVKVVKNKPAYFNQSMMEVTILDLLNNTWDPNDEHHILRLKDQFIHCRHLCLVFELLSSNLYDLIKQNSFRGLSLSLVRVFTAQLLDCLTVLSEARLIHCDLKPENILLKTLQSPTIKVIDFGSACHERQTVYTYIQSRFYRSPEVLLGLPYSSTIDMWSLGCICVELFLGLPLFPGTSEYNQLSRIVEMLGVPPTYMLEVGKQAAQFFEPVVDQYGAKSYRLKALQQYAQERGADEQPSKRYFSATALPEIVYTYPMARKDAKAADVQKEMNTRNSFIDFVQGLLDLNPMERWSPQQAKMHPFILGIPLTEPYHPPMAGKLPSRSTQSTSKIASTPTQIQPQQAPVRKYGGLPPAPAPPQARTYQDAAAYNRHLSQQQALTAMHQANANRAAQMPTNPYVEAPLYSSNQRLSTSGLSNLPPAHTQPGRGRSMTLVDAVPPQMQRIGMDLAAGGKSMTPVLRREDQALAWERRQKGGDLGRKASLNRQHHPALDLLTQQAESGYRPYLGGPSYAPQYQTPFTVVVDGQHQQNMPLSTPPIAHTSTHRYSVGGSQAGPFDEQYDGGMGMMYAPLQAGQLPQDNFWRPN